MTTIGGPGRVINIDIDPGRMRAAGVTVQDIKQTLFSANAGAPLGELVADNRSVRVQTGPFLDNVRDVVQLLVAVHGGRPVFLADIAELRDGPPPAQRYVWRGDGGGAPREAAAVTLGITKNPARMPLMSRTRSSPASPSCTIR